MSCILYYAYVNWNLEGTVHHLHVLRGMWHIWSALLEFRVRWKSTLWKSAAATSYQPSQERTTLSVWKQQRQQRAQKCIQTGFQHGFQIMIQLLGQHRSGTTRPGRSQPTISPNHDTHTNLSPPIQNCISLYCREQVYKNAIIYCTIIICSSCRTE